MKLFIGKGRLVEENIFKYLELINSVKSIFVQALGEYFKTGNISEMLNRAKNLHTYESKADDLRRDIERALYGKVLLPEFRGDIIRLLERLDKLPGECQSILFMISLQNMEIPEIFKEKLDLLIEVNAQTIDEVINLIRALFRDPKEVEKYVKKIDVMESESDAAERELIHKIFFTGSVDKYDKILLKELVLEIGSISDNAESISDMATIINIKVKL